MVLVSAAGTARAAAVVPTTLVFDTELLSLDLGSVSVPLPLASDPTNALGDSVEGYGWVNSSVRLSLSSQRATNPGPASLGQTIAFPADLPAAAGTGRASLASLDGRVNPAALDGQPFYVQSFFDVFFDIQVTDVDPRTGRDFAGMPDGSVVRLPDNGPASMQNNWLAVFNMSMPNFGLIPPPEGIGPYLGHFDIEIPLGA